MPSSDPIDRFTACLKVVLDNEGGFADDPQDPGGPTKQGVTLNMLSAYLGRSATIADLKALTPRQLGDIYSHYFWRPAHAADCPAGVDLMVLDAAVNSGPARAVRWLQQAVGVMPDGAVGPATLKALGAEPPERVITLYAALRTSFLRGLPDASHFPGWFSRVTRTAASAQAMASASERKAS